MVLRETDEGYFFWYMEVDNRKLYSQLFDSPSAANFAKMARTIVWNW